jgi:hypothetical protein
LRLAFRGDNQRHSLHQSKISQSALQDVQRN